MRIHIGNIKSVQNPTEIGKRIYVNLEDENIRKTHLQFVGSTQLGKSKWLEGFCRKLFELGIGFTVIDPKGNLAEDLISYFAYILPSRPVVYFDPSRTDYLIPFNPLFSEADNEEGNEKEPPRVNKFQESILKVWGVENVDATPRLGRYLPCVCHILGSGEFTINEVSDLLIWPNKAMREYATNFIQNKDIKNEWVHLLSYKTQRDFDGQIESTRSRFFRFAEPVQIKRIMGLPINNLDFRKVFGESLVVIANLKDTYNDSLSKANARLLGTMIISNLCSVALGKPGKPSRPYFLFVDEVQNFMTPDIKHILDMGAGKGLHLGVFHQHFEQFKGQDWWTFKSILTNAKIKGVFGGLPKEDNLSMVNELFGKIIYDRQERKYRSTEYFSSDKDTIASMLKEQPVRHYVIKMPGYEATPLISPKVGDYWISPDRKERLILDYFIKPYALSVEYIDQQLNERLEGLKARVNETEDRSESEDDNPKTFRVKKRFRK